MCKIHLLIDKETIKMPSHVINQQVTQQSVLNNNEKVEVLTQLKKTSAAMFSIDYDGVLGDRDERAVTLFADKFSKHIKLCQFNLAKIAIGTARQSQAIDYLNLHHNRNGSCYPRYVSLTEKINRRLKENVATVDPYLLVDSVNGFLHGQAYCMALADPYGIYLRGHGQFISKSRAYGYSEDSKIPLIYAQLMKFASEVSADKRYFYFYDDRKDIIDELTKFFSDNGGTRVPQGIELRLVRVDVSSAKITELSHAEISGIGSVDPKWEERVVAMLGEDTRPIEKLSQQRPIDVPNALAFYYHAAQVEKNIEITKRNEENARRREAQRLYAIEYESKRLILEEDDRKQYVAWVQQHILIPMTQKRDNLVANKGELGKQKSDVLRVACDEITGLLTQAITPENKTVRLLHAFIVTKMNTLCEKAPIDKSQRKFVDTLRFFAGILCSLPTAGFIWFSKSYRNKFFNTDSRAIADGLAEANRQYHVIVRR